MTNRLPYRLILCVMVSSLALALFVAGVSMYFDYKVTMDSIRSTVFDRFYERLFRQAVQIFLISLFILFIIKYPVGRRLGSMAAYVRELRPDRLDKPLVPIEERRGEKQDELDQVAAAINSMSSVLRNSFHELDAELHRRKSAEGTLVAERKLAEEALRKSEEQYRSLFDESKDVVFINTLEGRFIDINQAGVELFGYHSKEELLEADIERDLYVHLGYRKELLKLLDEAGHVKDYELLMKNKNGDILIVLETATAFRDKMGRVTSYRGMLRDITHQRKLEQQLMQAQKMEAVGQLAGGIAHDFNNFLTAIMGYAGMLQMGMEKGDTLRAYVQQILGSAERAATLTKHILIFSRKQTIDIRPARINEIIIAIEKLISRLIGEDIELKLMLSKEDLTIRADIGQIEQILMNLATNARDAMPDGGMLTIKTEFVIMDDEFKRTYGYGKEGPFVVLTVSDTGEGMDERTRDRIFEPFFTTKEAGKGTGLGLAMVHGIVTQHNGYISVDSEPGEGSLFRICLPLIEDAVEDQITLGHTDEIGGTETVLLAEDDTAVRNMGSGLLAQFGYRVVEAVDGEDAIEKFREHRDLIHLVILDVIMPKKNGKEVYNKMVQIKPGIKVIFASGYPAELVHRKGIIEEGVEFISKPFAPSQLLQTLRRVLNQ